MAVKTITITTDAYDALCSYRATDESFSQIILKITQKPKLSDFIGILSEKTAEKLEKDMKARRKQFRTR